MLSISEQSDGCVAANGLNISVCSSTKAGVVWIWALQLNYCIRGSEGRSRGRYRQRVHVSHNIAAGIRDGCRDAVVDIKNPIRRMFISKELQVKLLSWRRDRLIVFRKSYIHLACL
jgi:hypothetical protein